MVLAASAVNRLTSASTTFQVVRIERVTSMGSASHMRSSGSPVARARMAEASGLRASRRALSRAVSSAVVISGGIMPVTLVTERGVRNQSYREDCVKSILIHATRICIMSL